MPRKNKTGFTGVYLKKTPIDTPYEVRLYIGGTTKRHIGFFATLEQASEAYLQAKIRYLKGETV